MCSDLGCRVLLTRYDLASPLLAAQSPVLWNTAVLLPPTPRVYSVCPYVRVLPVCLLTELRSCCIASGGSPATQNVTRRESTSKPFYTRIHPYARQHRQYGNIPEEKVLDTGCGQHVLHKRGPSRDTVTKKSSNFQWFGIRRLKKNNKPFQQKCINCRGFIFKNKHVTLSLQITDIRGNCQSSLLEYDRDLNQWRVPTSIESELEQSLMRHACWSSQQLWRNIEAKCVGAYTVQYIVCLCGDGGYSTSRIHQSDALSYSQVLCIAVFPHTTLNGV